MGLTGLEVLLWTEQCQDSVVEYGNTVYWGFMTLLLVNEAGEQSTAIRSVWFLLVGEADPKRAVICCTMFVTQQALAFARDLSFLAEKTHPSDEESSLVFTSVLDIRNAGHIPHGNIQSTINTT